MYSQNLISKKIYPELPELVPVVLSVCQNFYCDQPFRDLSLSSNTWLQAKNWHARKQIWFKDILKLQEQGKSLSGFPGLFSAVCSEGEPGDLRLSAMPEGRARDRSSWDPSCCRRCPFPVPTLGLPCPTGRFRGKRHLAHVQEALMLLHNGSFWVGNPRDTRLST